MSYRKFIGLGVVILALFIIQVQAEAGDTASSTTISNRATVLWNVSGSLQETETVDIDTTVSAIASDTLTSPTDQNGAVGESRVFTYTIYNTGNKADTFNIMVDSFTMNGGAASWAFSVHVDTEITSVEDDTIVTTSIAADGTKTCSVTVWINSAPANSPNGSFADFRLVIAPGNLAAADTAYQYTGDNNITYAWGSAGSSDVARATVQAAVMTLTKTIPMITIGGDSCMPLPGATITYMMTYTNTGSDTADSVVIQDTIATTQLTFDTMSRSGADLGSTATFTTDTLFYGGWLAQITTASPAANGFSSGDWINANTWDGTGTVLGVRWIKQEVGPAETATLRFRAIIK